MVEGGGGDTSYPALSVNDNFIVSNKEKASTFNDFFLSQSRIDTSNADLPPVTPTPVGIDSIQATESEVLDLVLSLDCTKSAGPDGISPKLLRLAGNMIVPSLTKLFNKSFHWAQRYVPITLGIHWVCIGNVLNPAN